MPLARPDSELSDDFNSQIYYRNRLELALDVSYLPFNIPLIFDPIIGDPWSRVAGTVNYTLVPINATVRWQLYDPCGPSILRGNLEVTTGGFYTAITQGPESYYTGMDFGLRYNFVQPNWRIAPYFDLRGGFGWTDAQQPYEKAHGLPEVGQGQDLTFNFIMGAGMRYNFNPRYGVSAGLSYMHISNAGLSTPQYYNHGVNVWGPTVGFNMKLPSFAAMKESATSMFR